MLYVLDSTVLIDYLRGRPAVERLRDLRSRGGVPATSALNAEEITRGVRDGETEATDRLFAGLLVLPIDLESGRRAGLWRREYARRGVTLWQADCLIAATTYLHGGRLVTGNPKDFPMEGLDVEHWPVGE